MGNARAKATKSILQVDLGDYSEALTSAMEASDTAQRRKSHDVLCLSWFAMGLASRGMGQEKEAQHSLNRALQIAKQHKLHALQIRVLQALDRTDEAEDLARSCGIAPEDEA